MIYCGSMENSFRIERMIGSIGKLDLQLIGFHFGTAAMNGGPAFWNTDGLQLACTKRICLVAKLSD